MRFLKITSTITIALSVSTAAYSGMIPNVSGNVAYADNEGTIVLEHKSNKNKKTIEGVGQNVIQSANNAGINVNGAIAKNSGDIRATLESNKNKDSMIGVGQNVIQSR